MLRALIAMIAILGLCSTAQATGELYCSSLEGDVELNIGLGRVPVFAPLSAVIVTPTGTLSTEDGSIGSVSGFYEPDAILVDFADEIVLDLVARLRVFHASEPNGYAMAGVLQIVGDAAYAVICEQG